MWALVKNNSVVEIFKQPKATTIDTIQYPKNIFTLWSDSELEAIGIYKVTENGSGKNSDLYTNTYKDEFKDLWAYVDGDSKEYYDKKLAVYFGQFYKDEISPETLLF